MHATTVVSWNDFFVCKMEMGVKCFLNFLCGGGFICIIALTTTLRCIHTQNFHLFDVDRDLYAVQSHFFSYCSEHVSIAHELVYIQHRLAKNNSIYILTRELWTHVHYNMKKSEIAQHRDHGLHRIKKNSIYIAPFTSFLLLLNGIFQI